jgi:hypothetical protein
MGSVQASDTVQSPAGPMKIDSFTFNGNGKLELVPGRAMPANGGVSAESAVELASGGTKMSMKMSIKATIAASK